MRRFSYSSSNALRAARQAVDLPPPTPLDIPESILAACAAVIGVDEPESGVLRVYSIKAPRGAEPFEPIVFEVPGADE